jgi:hypothetical protein
LDAKKSALTGGFQAVQKPLQSPAADGQKAFSGL